MAGNPKYYGTFDAQGNFVSGITYTWDGRRLASLTDNTNATAVQYAYNDKGLRTKKTINGVIHNYYYDGEMLICEKYSDITKRFIYDENGMVTSFILKNGTTENIYFYVRDIFGIINYLVDISGAIVVFYSYDSWGKLLSTGGTLSSTIGVQNPFLYKGYYFDFETSLYYCHSRYYNPMWHRWLNADSVDNLDAKSSNGFNLFAYCGNNPIMYVDPSGCSPEWLITLGWIGLAVGAALVITAITILTCGVGTLAGTMAGAVIYGAAQGIAIGAGVGVVGGGIVGGIASGWEAEGILVGAGIGLGAGAIVGGVIGGFAGASSFATNSAYITQNGGNVKEVLSAFKGNPKLTNISQGTNVYRVWGGNAPKIGRWVSPNIYADPVSKLALNPVWGNTATNVSTLVFNQNAQVLVGSVAAQGSLAGGGIQWFVGNLAWLALL